MGALVAIRALTRFIFSDALASILFSANLIPVYGLLWIVDGHLADQGKFWVPFRPHELSSLAIAVLAPPLRTIGILAIMIFPALATLRYSLFQPEQLVWLPARPLIPPFAFAMFALVLYFFRLQGLRIAKQAAEKGAELKMMRKLARSVLAIKDLANSPIQSLTLDSELLSRRHPEEAELTNRIRSAISKLQELNNILDSHAPKKENLEGQVSLDSMAELSK
jgi:hypothetical protein